jgi:hypothetical protein
MIIVRLLSPEPWLVGTTKVYSGVGADIVMESITLSDPVVAVVIVLALVALFTRGKQTKSKPDTANVSPKKVADRESTDQLQL